MTTHAATLPMKEIQRFCARWKVADFSLFGSTLRSDFSDDSDVDVLVSFADEAKWGLYDMVTMRDELQRIFGREVDLVSRSGIEASRNAYRKQAILESAERIYGA